jgi:hypothetical protein
MKTISKILFISSTLLLLVVGCTKDFEEINYDPNRPVSVESGYILTYAQKALMDNLRDEWFGGRCTQSLAQHWAQRNYTEEDRYAHRTTVTNNAWRAFYRIAYNLERIIKLNTDPATQAQALGSGPNEHQIAVAKILKVWIMSIATDTWGDIPYSEAFQSNVIREPKYDRQQDLYPVLIQELKDAAAMINPANGDLTRGDVIYGGDVAKWKKFANTLRLRMALRMSKRSTTQLNDVMTLPASSFFESNDDNAIFTYQASSPNQGPVYVAFFVNARNDFTISKTLVDIMAGRNDVLNSKTNPLFGVAADPRLPIFAYQVGGVWQGMPHGMENNQTAQFAVNCPNYLNNPSVVHAADFGYTYMDYAELCFMMSEVNSWDQTWYERGIRASMEFWGAATADIDAYIASVPAASMATVMTQKYIAYYMQPEQAWFEYRRTGYPNMLVKPGEITHQIGATNVLFNALEGTDIPRRVLYPQDEQGVNKAQYTAAVAVFGADALNTRVWWDMP